MEVLYLHPYLLYIQFFQFQKVSKFSDSFFLTNPFQSYSIRTLCNCFSPNFSSCDINNFVRGWRPEKLVNNNSIGNNDAEVDLSCELCNLWFTYKASNKEELQDHYATCHKGEMIPDDIGRELQETFNSHDFQIVNTR